MRTYFWRHAIRQAGTILRVLRRIRCCRKLVAESVNFVTTQQSESVPVVDGLSEMYRLVVALTVLKSSLSAYSSVFTDRFTFLFLLFVYPRSLNRISVVSRGLAVTKRSDMKPRSGLECRWNSWLVIGRRLAQISGGTPFIPSSFVIFPWSYQANITDNTSTRPRLLPSVSLKIHHSLFIPPFNVDKLWLASRVRLFWTVNAARGKTKLLSSFVTNAC